MIENYPWYKTLDQSDYSLNQGDFIDSLPILKPLLDIDINQERNTDVSEFNVVILTQSCDLANDKIEFVLVAPYYPMENFISEQHDTLKSNKEIKSFKEKVRLGFLPGYHLLNKCELENYSKDFSIVDFRNVYGVHIGFLREYTKKLGKRLRLLPPYREHLSQSFAKFFMRVGLPTDIPSFK
ncbi:hypothetical protein IT568_02620 [bacterium]|nr:hypothetical protein [bacterium]